MENKQCGLWKNLRQRLGKQPQTEEVRYAVEFELLRMLADAECYHDLHKYAAQSLSIEPGNIYAYYWLIYSMVHLGSFDLAKSEYEIAQRYLTDEEYEELTAMLRNLSNLAPEDLFYIRKLPDA